MKKSLFGKLNLKDLVRGALLAAGTSVMASVATAVNSGELPNMQQIQIAAAAGLCAGLTYLLKNILTNSTDELLRGER